MGKDKDAKPVKAEGDATGEKAAPPEAQAPANRQVFVNGFRAATAEQIREFFQPCGGVVKMTNKSGKEKTVYKRETVLCTFKKDKAVAKAIEMSGQSLAGRPVKVGLNTEPLAEAKQAEGSERVFVGNLPFDITPAKVQTMFEACGDVLWVRFAYDDDKKFRGFCHVTFRGTTGVPIEKALELDGAEIAGREIHVGRAQGKLKWSEQKARAAANDGDSSAAADDGGGDDGSGGKRKKGKAQTDASGERGRSDRSGDNYFDHGDAAAMGGGYEKSEKPKRSKWN